MITFRDAIRQKDFVVLAALPLTLESSAENIRESVDVLSGVVDAMHVADDLLGLGHMSGLAAASISIQHGLDAVLSISCRDRNRIALQADLLGAAALGVTSLLLLRGDKFPGSGKRYAKGVFEIDSTRLMELAQLIGEEKNLISSPGLFLGSKATVFAPEEDWTADRVVAKIAAGARFLHSQPCLNVDLVSQYAAWLVKLKIVHQASLIVEVPLLTGESSARALKDMHPAAAIGTAIFKRFAAAKHPIAEGEEICAEVVAGLKDVPGVSGVNIRHDGDLSRVTRVLKLAGHGN